MPEPVHFAVYLGFPVWQWGTSSPVGLLDRRPEMMSCGPAGCQQNGVLPASSRCLGLTLPAARIMGTLPK